MRDDMMCIAGKKIKKKKAFFLRDFDESDDGVTYNWPELASAIQRETCDPRKASLFTYNCV